MENVSVLGIQKIQIDGGIFMTEKHIKLSPDTVVTFVKKSQQCDFNIDISYGHEQVRRRLAKISQDARREDDFCHRSVTVTERITRKN